MATTVESVVSLVADLAARARRLGTYGVGALLLDKTGNILCQTHNRVIIDGILADPTAHAERRLVDWYYSQARESVPPERDITLVTSVDPCCMCAGAVLTAGFRVVVAANDTHAGVNWDLCATYSYLAGTELHRAAFRTFAYPSVVGRSSLARKATGFPIDAKLFTSRDIDAETLKRCHSTFEETLATVKPLAYDGIASDRLLDSSLLSSSHPIVSSLKKLYPNALEYRAPSRYRPDAGLGVYLKAAMKVDVMRGGEGDAVALLDHFGNLILCVPGNLRRSPVQTAFMRCVRLYAALRLKLSAFPSLNRFLHPPRYGTFVFARGPDLSSRSFMDLGVYGSAIEGPIPETNPFQFQYVRPLASPMRILKFCAEMPPLYSREIKINPTQVADRALVKLIS